MRHLDVWRKSRTDHQWNDDGGQEVSGPWPGCILLTVMNEKTPDGYTWSGRRLTKNPSNIWTRLRVGWSCQVCLKQLKRKRGSVGRLRNQSSTMFEVFSIRTIWSFGMPQKRAKKVGRASGIHHALLGSTPWALGKPLQKKSDNRKSRCAHVSLKPTSLRESATTTSKGEITKILLQKRSFQVVDAPQLGAHYDTHVPCHENSGCEGRSRHWEGKGRRKPRLREVIEKAQKERRTVHFATLMDLYHLKNSELEHKFQKYKGQVVLLCVWIRVWMRVCSVNHGLNAHVLQHFCSSSRNKECSQSQKTKQHNRFTWSRSCVAGTHAPLHAQ